MSVDYHYKVGLGLTRFGIVRRAREEWQQALALAERHRLNDWYFRIESALAGLEESVERNAQIPAPEPADPPAWMAGVSAGLREFAEEYAR
jgi:hypothetical protein